MCVCVAVLGCHALVAAVDRLGVKLGPTQK